MACTPPSDIRKCTYSFAAFGEGVPFTMTAYRGYAKPVNGWFSSMIQKAKGSPC